MLNRLMTNAPKLWTTMQTTSSGSRLNSVETGSRSRRTATKITRNATVESARMLNW